CDGFGYDWSDQAEEGPTNFALMAYSSTSSSSSTNSEVSNDSNCCSSCLECVKDLKEQNEQLFKDLRTAKISVISYKTGLESVEARLKENGALIIEDLVSECKEEDVPKVKTVEILNKPSFAKINFVKSTEQVNNVKGTRVNTARTKAVLSVVKGNKGNAVKASACWVWRPKHKVLDHVSRNNSASMSFQRFDYIDAQGRSKFYLTDYEEIDRGFVAFGANSKGGKIIRKGKIRIGNLDFEDVYIVKQLKFNLFSVLQMCDKKNNVLFTDIECIVLSPDFKLTDGSHVLLKVPKKDNMYSVDLKFVVRQGGFTCLFAKATPDESNLWHRRLEYVNFKTMNKLGNSPNDKVGTKACADTGGEEKKDAKDPENESGNQTKGKDNNDKDVGAEADMNNLNAFMHVSPIPTTRIHKDHPVEQIIGDLNLAPQTRRMTKNLKEHGLFSLVQQRTNHKDFQNCLFACFLSQEEPKKAIQALKDPS
ncbi:hypothetical protein Tco_0493591, partial [Tanacetum coccineum]